MNAEALARHILELLEGVDTVEADGDTFFFFNPGGEAHPIDHRAPFATIVTSDAHDRASDLDRPGVYRLNIGVSRDTYESMFGAPPKGPITADPVDTGHDYTRLDMLMPHPIYASLNWISVVNPGVATLDLLDALIEEAQAIAAGRRARRDVRG